MFRIINVKDSHVFLDINISKIFITVQVYTIIKDYILNIKRMIINKIIFN